MPFFSSRPQRTENTLRVRQRGVSIIAAIFLLLLMAGLAAAMANIMSSTHINLASDIGGSRAYQAARAGVEWAMVQPGMDPNAGEPDIDNINCPGAGSPTVPNHIINIQCTAYPLAGGHYSEGSKTIRIFHIIAIATATGVKQPGIERQIEVTVEKCRDTGNEC